MWVFVCVCSLGLQCIAQPQLKRSLSTAANANRAAGKDTVSLSLSLSAVLRPGFSINMSTIWQIANRMESPKKAAAQNYRVTAEAAD